MAINLKPVDVAVIGLGAAGGVAVLPLARAGLKIAAIEAGTWMDPRQFRPDEIHNNVRGQVTSVPKTKREVPTIRPTASSPARRAAVHPMMNAIGGTTIHYWAQSWRLKPWDFRTRSEVIRRYGANAIPAGSTLEDWPLTYDELEPYYDIVEHEIGVSGKAGNLQGASIRRGISSKRRDSANIPCRRCAAPVSASEWRRPRASWAGIPSGRQRRSTPSRTGAGRLAPITDIAPPAGATSARRTRPP